MSGRLSPSIQQISSQMTWGCSVSFIVEWFSHCEPEVLSSPPTSLIPTNSTAAPSQQGKAVQRVRHGEQRGQTARALKPPGFPPSPIGPQLRPFYKSSQGTAAALPGGAIPGKGYEMRGMGVWAR